MDKIIYFCNINSVRSKKVEMFSESWSAFQKLNRIRVQSEFFAKINNEDFLNFDLKDQEANDDSYEVLSSNEIHQIMEREVEKVRNVIAISMFFVTS